MNMENIIASCILIMAVAGIIALTVYKFRKQNKEITIEEFIGIYYENIIAALQDVVELLQINLDEFDDKESYDKAIISTTIDKLKENASEFGIDTALLDIFNTDALTDAIYGIFCEEEEKVFSVIGYEAMSSTPELYNPSVVNKIKHDENDVI